MNSIKKALFQIVYYTFRNTRKDRTLFQGKCKQMFGNIYSFVKEMEWILIFL